MGWRLSAMRIKDNKLVKMESTGSLGRTYFKIPLLGIALIIALIIILIIEVNAKEKSVGVSGEGYKVGEDMDEVIEKARKEREEKEGKKLKKGVESKHAARYNSNYNKIRGNYAL